MPLRIVIVLLLLVMVMNVAAQSSDCPFLAQQAFSQVGEFCEQTQRDEVCYANINVEAIFRPGNENIGFTNPGDIAPVGIIQSLNLSRMQTPDVWGVTLMRVQANLTEENTTQFVTVVIFGGVSLENHGTSPVTLQVSSTTGVNVRSGPGTNFEPVTALTTEQIVIADGRNQQADWLRVVLDNGSRGWVATNLLTFEGDVSILPVVEGLGSLRANYNPMQAFTFTSEGDAPACDEAPQDGILIQTPEGVGEINFLINEVDIRLGSTVYLQAQPSNTMRISVLEGEAEVTALHSTVAAPAGTRAIVPLDENALPSGVPRLEVYQVEDVATVPISILPESIFIASPADLEALIATRAPNNGIYTSPGYGLFTYLCSNGSAIDFYGNPSSITIAGDAETLEVTRNEVEIVSYRATSPGIYTGETYTNTVGVVITPVITVISGTELVIQEIWDLSDSTFGCRDILNTPTERYTIVD